MLLKFTNTDSDGNPTTEELAVTVNGTRYEIETNGAELVEVPDDVGEHMLAEGFAVEEASNEDSEQQVSDAVEMQAVDVDEEVDEAEEVDEEPADETEYENENESESESEADNDLPEV